MRALSEPVESNFEQFCYRSKDLMNSPPHGSMEDLFPDTFESLVGPYLNRPIYIVHQRPRMEIQSRHKRALFSLHRYPGFIDSTVHHDKRFRDSAEGGRFFCKCCGGRCPSYNVKLHPLLESNRGKCLLQTALQKLCSPDTEDKKNQPQSTKFKGLSPFKSNVRFKRCD